MENFTDEQVLEMYKKLPKDLKEVIFSDEMKGLVKSIGEKYKLPADKIRELENETGMVMLGVIHPRDFVSNLAKRLGVDQQTAGKISEDVNSQIFAKVKESLEKVHGKESQISNLKSQINFEKEEILQEIERDHAADIVSLKPAAPVAASKVEEAVVSKVEPKYPAGDPYREPVD